MAHSLGPPAPVAADIAQGNLTIGKVGPKMSIGGMLVHKGLVVADGFEKDLLGRRESIGGPIGNAEVVQDDCHTLMKGHVLWAFAKGFLAKRLTLRQVGLFARISLIAFVNIRSVRIKRD